jgi:uncharacterized protein YbcI
VPRFGGPGGGKRQECLVGEAAAAWPGALVGARTSHVATAFGGLALNRFRSDRGAGIALPMSQETTDPEEKSGDGFELLARVSTEMVQMQKEYFGRGPVRAKSYMLDDLLVTVMRGGTTTAERTLLDAGRADVVRAFRQEWQNTMGERLIARVEELTGRKVATYQSQVMFEPDTVVELFLFEEPAPAAAVHATAERLARNAD